MRNSNDIVDLKFKLRKAWHLYLHAQSHADINISKIALQNLEQRFIPTGRNQHEFTEISRSVRFDVIAQMHMKAPEYDFDQYPPAKGAWAQ